MVNSKRLIKIIGIVVFIICIVCIALLYFVNKDNEEVQNSENVVVGDPLVVEYSTEKLRDPTKFFSVQQYIRDNLNEQFVAEEMNILNEERITSFAVRGYIPTDNSEDIQEIYLIFRVDTENNTFLMEVQENINNIDNIDLVTDLTEIAQDSNNGFEYTTVTSEDMCRIYLDNFTNLELEGTESAYNLLDEEYQKERFPTLQNYQEYVSENQSIIGESVLAQYSVDYKDDYTQYILVDNFGNSYTVKETSIMNYNIMLDNYTIKVDGYDENYNKLSDENKVQSNVYIFLQMLNMKDYEHAYDLLDDTFKSNNFPTLDDFKEYVKQNFFIYNFNSSSEVNITQEGEYYIYTTTIRNSSGSAAESRSLTVIMKLLEGTDFVMSFSIE